MGQPRPRDFLALARRSLATREDRRRLEHALERRRRVALARSAHEMIGMPLDELRRIRDLAVETWGDRASIFVRFRGVVEVGYFTDDDRPAGAGARVPPQWRPQVVVAAGSSYREIKAQIDAAKDLR